MKSKVSDLILYQVFEKHFLSPLIQSANYPLRILFIRCDNRTGWNDLGKPKRSNKIASLAFEHTNELSQGWLNWTAYSQKVLRSRILEMHVHELYLRWGTCRSPKCINLKCCLRYMVSSKKTSQWALRITVVIGLIMSPQINISHR